jgi:Protein of unknown function (DUF1688)
MTPEHALALSLLSPKAVRTRTRMLYEAGLDGGLNHFRVHTEKLPALADYVVETIRQNYPTLDIPFHARWRHFMAAGQNLWAETDQATQWTSQAHRGRAAYDLAICSVLLDAGAGAEWSYRDGKTGLVFSRSEGLGIASLRMFQAGVFSADPTDPLRVDGAKLANLTVGDLARGFQVADDNPLVGLEGRAALLRRLGETVRANHLVFASKDRPRPGGLFDHLSAQAKANSLPAPAILEALLLHLGGIWPGRIRIGRVSLGDCWKHPLVKTSDATNGLVPFHKLSQWMAYSLIEPLQWSGLEVTDIDGLTGLPEYRNGGLFLDGGVISLKDKSDATIAHEPGSLLVVEWRALTVALLDNTAVKVRQLLGMDAMSLPLAKVLEGGTWAAGRRIARENRAGGGPPLSIISDGTVF